MFWRKPQLDISTARYRWWRRFVDLMWSKDLSVWSLMNQSGAAQKRWSRPFEHRWISRHFDQYQQFVRRSLRNRLQTRTPEVFGWRDSKRPASWPTSPRRICLRPLAGDRPMVGPCSRCFLALDLDQTPGLIGRGAIFDRYVCAHPQWARLASRRSCLASRRKRPMRPSRILGPWNRN